MPSILGVMMSLLGALTAIAALAVVAAVVWLDLANAQQVAYGALVVRVVVIGGFLLVLAWLLWRVGMSLIGPRRDGDQGAR